MTIWNTLSQGLGAYQDATSNAMDLQFKARQIQQMQMAIDAQKQALMAHPAIAAFLSQGGASGGQPPGPMPSTGGSQGGPQMPMTGAPPPPGMPPGGAPGGAPAMPPGAPSQPPPQQGVMPPVVNGAAGGAPPMPRPPMGAPPPGAIPPPQAPSPGGGTPMGMQSPGMDEKQQGPGGGPGAFDPQQTIMKIAAGIKKANPNIAPEVLLDATNQFIDMMKGVNPDIRNQLQMYLGQLRAQTSTANTAARDQTAITDTNARVASTNRGQDLAHADRVAALDAKISEFGQREARLTAKQGASGGKPAKESAADRIGLQAAGNAITQARARLSDVVRNRGGVVNENDPAISGAERALDTAITRKGQLLDKIEARVASGADGGSGPPPISAKGVKDGTTAKEYPGWKVKDGQWVR